MKIFKDEEQKEVIQDGSSSQAKGEEQFMFLIERLILSWIRLKFQLKECQDFWNVVGHFCNSVRYANQVFWLRQY